MPRRILVPLDGSRFAEAALPAALRLSRRDAARLELVRVLEPPLPPARTGTAPVRDPTFDRVLQQEAREYLDGLIAGLDESDRARTRGELLGGHAAAALADRIRAHDVDLVVMTTHARGGASRAWLGSVADGLVRRAAVPVLLLRPPMEEGVEPEDGRFGRVLVPLDGSEAGARVLDHAVDVAGTRAVQYLLLRVLACDAPALAEVVPHRGEPATTRAQRASVLSALEGAADALRARGLDVRTATVTDDSPARGILGYAVDQGVDLIAMATRSRGGLERWVLGSVADKVLRSTTRPVLLFNPGGDRSGAGE